MSRIASCKASQSSRVARGKRRYHRKAFPAKAVEANVESHSWSLDFPFLNAWTVTARINSSASSPPSPLKVKISSFPSEFKLTRLVGLIVDTRCFSYQYQTWKASLSMNFRMPGSRCTQLVTENDRSGGRKVGNPRANRCQQLLKLAPFPRCRIHDALTQPHILQMVINACFSPHQMLYFIETCLDLGQERFQLGILWQPASGLMRKVSHEIMRCSSTRRVGYDALILQVCILHSHRECSSDNTLFDIPTSYLTTNTIHVLIIPAMTDIRMGSIIHCISTQRLWKTE